MSLPADTVLELDFTRHVQDLRETWQGRVLRETHNKVIGPVVLSVLSHNFDDALLVLLKAIFPDFAGIRAPFICSAAKISKRGFIVADMVLRNDPHVRKDCVVFYSLCHMQAAFRRLADRLKFNDEDRRQLFAAARNWVVADRRLDPTMDPADPDARRLGSPAGAH
jgi:hypothetical protein